MYDILLYCIAFLCFLLVIFLALKILGSKDKVRVRKDNLKKIEDLKKVLENNPEDYDSMLELARLEDKVGDYESAIDRYEKLMEVGYLRDYEKLQICKRLEDKYDKLGEKDKSFLYSVKIIKSEPENTFYLIKIGTILGKNGYNLVASNYFNKALLSRSEFEIESLKVAAFSFFNIRDYKKSIKFLEEYYKRISRYSNRNADEIHDAEKSLISMYIMVDELNVAKSFTESILLDKNIDDDFKFYINKIYLFILYKLGDNERFKKVYDNLHELYLKEENVDYADLILDYSFYSYFLRYMELSAKYFETVKSFNKPKFEIYDIDTILKYLNQINKATVQLTLLRKEKNNLNDDRYINDNFERYIDKTNIETWEDSINTWEKSFVDLSYISNLIQVEKTINVNGRMLEELKNVIDSSEPYKHETAIKKVDKIYDLNINEFKKVCKSIITSKLSYVIAQEYEDKFNGNNGDEINYLAYNINGSKKELTLISFKRWKKSLIGELMVRDFFMMVNEVDAKKGILIVPIELSNSARSYVSHNDRIIVYSRDQFNSLLKDERF